MSSRPALDHAGGHARRADRAEQQRVERPPLVEQLVGEDRAVAQVAGAAEVVVDGVELDAGGGDDLERLGHHLGADAVAPDDSDLVSHAVLSDLLGY